MKKNDFFSLEKKLKAHELKNIMGGKYKIMDCYRMRKSDHAYFRFTIESVEVGMAWWNVWAANDGWVADCTIQTILEPIDYVTKEC